MGQRTLKDIRLAAGWRSARAFAEHVGIPVSTYSVYEKEPGSIRLDAARSIARELGCSVAELAGDPAPAPDPGPVQRAYDGLGDRGRELADAFLKLLGEAEAAAARERGFGRRAYACGLFEAYIDDFRASRDLFDGPDERSSFRAYAEGRLRAHREAGPNESYRAALERLRAPGALRGADRAEVEAELAAIRDAEIRDAEEEDEGMLEDIMRAYDAPRRLS